MKKNRLSERILFSYKIFVNNVRENFIVAVLELSATLGLLQFILHILIMRLI